MISQKKTFTQLGGIFFLIPDFKIHTERDFTPQLQLHIDKISHFLLQKSPPKFWTDRSRVSKWRPKHPYLHRSALSSALWRCSRSDQGPISVQNHFQVRIRRLWGSSREQTWLCGHPDDVIADTPAARLRCGRPPPALINGWRQFTLQFIGDARARQIRHQNHAWKLNPY